MNIISSNPTQSVPVKPKEIYSQAGNRIFEEIMDLRTAEGEGGFFLKHLTPEMRVLDVGCASGTITLGFAEAAYHGEVFGIDFQPALIAKAQALSAERRIMNAHFEVANAYELPFPDASMDAVFENAVLWHLGDPKKALAEMCRVLRPGGIIGIRECDWGNRIHTPITPTLEKWYEMTVKIRQHNGGDPYMGLRNSELLLDAGFANPDLSASVWKAETRDEVQACARFLDAQLRGFARTALEQQWMNEQDVNKVADEFIVWSNTNGAFYSDTYFEAIARKVA